VKISRKQLSLIIENYLLTEAVHDKVAAQLGITDPDKIDQLRIASEAPHRLQKPELLWIGKYFTTPEGMQTKEPIVDIVSAIKSLKQNRAALIRRGSATDLSDYESPGQITIAVTLSRGFVDISQLSEQVDVLYEDEDWTLYMPHSREASCTIGRGTAWCTAIPGSGNNLFYNYVISGRAILYYLVKKKKEENEPPSTTHFSLGTLDGKITFPKEGKGDGHIVVDGANKGLSRQRFLSQVGAPLGEQLITKIESHSQANSNKHPAKKKIIEMLRNPVLYTVEMRGKSIDIRYDFTAMMTTNFKDVFFFGSEDITDNDKQLIADVFVDPNNALNKAITAATEIKQKDVDTFNKALQAGNNAIVQKYGKIFGDASTINEAEYDVRRNVASASDDLSIERFCQGKDALTSAVPYYLYKKAEDMAESLANSWEGAELYEFDREAEALQVDHYVTSDFAYVIENDPAGEGFEGPHFTHFVVMLCVYQANILFASDYRLIHGYDGWSSQPNSYAGTLVDDLEDYMRTDPEQMYWINDKHPYAYEDFTAESFSASEIRQYMTDNFGQDFVQWCDSFGFDFTA
tara:strand:+ start:389 stop:2113 length:1725 start_codon:yes stop_codon:yes gene_type:complete